jgi:ribosomal protein S12 methylthiotransferase accessory factor YcaO
LKKSKSRCRCTSFADAESRCGAATYILGKDLPLEQTIANMSGLLANLGIKIEIASWRNIIPNVWSLHIRDAHSPMCFTNGKGATKESALASALGEYIERLSNNHFYAGSYWGEEIANAILCIIRMSNGSSRVAKMRCRKIFSMTTHAAFMTRTANCAARI